MDCPSGIRANGLPADKQMAATPSVSMGNTSGVIIAMPTFKPPFPLIGSSVPSLLHTTLLGGRGISLIELTRHTQVALPWYTYVYCSLYALPMG